MNKIQILFSGGGGLNGALYMGIAQYIFERYNLKNHSDKIHIGGVSVGAAVSTYLLAPIHNIQSSPKDWFESDYLTIARRPQNNFIYKTLYYVNKDIAKYCAPLFYSSNYIYDGAIEYYKKCHQANPEYYKILEKHFHTYTTVFDFSKLKLEKYKHDDFVNINHFAFSIYGTTLLPVISKFPFGFRDNYYQWHNDGCFSTTLPHNDELEDIPTIYFNRLITINPQHHITHINVNDWIPFSFKHLMIVADENDYREMFQLGYEKAKENSKILDNFFEKYLFE